MMLKRYYILVLLTVFPMLCVPGQAEDPISQETQVETTKRDFTFYGVLIHQHENFFREPFSFQGFETGLLVHNKFTLGAFASTFVSNLMTEFSGNPLYVSMGQGGIFAGRITGGKKVLHTGYLLNLGYFSLSGDDNRFPVFRSGNPSVRIRGWMASPQLYAEVYTARWMKIRTGIAYSFYFPVFQSGSLPGNIGGFSVSFGFLFGKFKDENTIFKAGCGDQ